MTHSQGPAATTPRELTIAEMRQTSGGLAKIADVTLKRGIVG